MKHMETKHWALVAAMLGTLATQISGLEHGWHDAVTPAFIGGLLGSIATTLTALFVGPPKQKESDE